MPQKQCDLDRGFNPLIRRSKDIKRFRSQMGSSSMEDDQSLKTPSGKSSSILCISWFIIPLTVDSSINHSYWSYKPTERYRTGAPPCMLLFICSPNIHLANCVRVSRFEFPHHSTFLAVAVSGLHGRALEPAVIGLVNLLFLGG